MTDKHTLLLNKWNILALLEVRNSNPNGDPDLTNEPRTDPETGIGIISDVSLKRKLRDYLEEVYSEELYHANGAVLREQRIAALLAEGITPTAGKTTTTEQEQTEAGDEPTETSKVKKGGRKAKGTVTTGVREGISEEDSARNRSVICRKYYDARAFGALMDTGAARAGNATGPVCVSPAESVDPVRIIDLTLTRQSVEKPEDRAKERGMGSKKSVRFGLYRFDVAIDPSKAAVTGFTLEDFEKLKDALINWPHEFSASRSWYSWQIFAFEHAAVNGKPSRGLAQRAGLLNRVKVKKHTGVVHPSSIDDYDISVDTENLPAGITFQRWI